MSSSNLNTQQLLATEPISDDAPALVTIFTIPKPFDGHIGVIQRNAIRSWKKLAENAPVRVVLFGDEEGIAEFAEEIEVRHISEIEKNESGTPLLSGCFQSAHADFESQYYCFINCDIILQQDFIETVQQFDARDFPDFLGIGRRVDVDITEDLDFREEWESEISEIAQSQGQLAPVVCKDYFVFPEHMYKEIPAFAVGRGNWDNWMVANANQSKTPVVDLTEVVTAIHQNHNYTHLGGGRLAAYVTGDEAKTNSKLAGGKNLISGATSNLKLIRQSTDYEFRVVKKSPFWSDLPNFLKLIGDLFLKRSSK